MRDGHEVSWALRVRILPCRGCNGEPRPMDETIDGDGSERENAGTTFLGSAAFILRILLY